MTLAEIKTMLDEIGLPVAYQFFPEEDCPDMPFITYNVSRNNNFSADDKSFKKVRHLEIHLFTQLKSVETEQLIDTVLDSHDLPWSAHEDYLSAERCYVINYETEVIYEQ